MGYRSLVKKNVDLAFKLIGDLAVDCVLTERTATTFHFNTGATATTDPVVKTIKGVLIVESNPKDVSVSLTAQLVFKASDLDKPDIYDKVTIDGFIWTIVPPFATDGYITTINLSRVS